MGSEQGADFYDNRMGRVGLPYEESPWRPIYDTIVGYLPSDRSTRIVDVGCGTGRCAEAIRRAGYHNYHGFDFSPVRIEEARRYVPSLIFSVLDVFSDEAKVLTSKADVVVVTEVLEHIDQDLDLVAGLPTGALVLFSVPNFDSAGHVRKFANAEAVGRRYGDLLELGDVVAIAKPTRPHKMTFVYRSTRK